ncbi:retrotransposon protein, putative, ty1-copia subclass, partial [Tanacetum coccineum]
WINITGIQLQAEEFDLMAAERDLDEIEEVNANCILMANLQQASTSGTQTDSAPVFDSDRSVEVHHSGNCYDDEIFNMFTQEEQYTEQLEPIPEPHQVHQNDSNVISDVPIKEQNGGTVEQCPANVEETRASYDSLYNNLTTEVERVNSVNRKLKATNAELTTELASYKNHAKFFEINQEKYDKLERCYQKSVYQEQCLTKKINALHLTRTITDFKIRKDEFLDKQILLEKKIKELDNLLVKTEARKLKQGALYLYVGNGVRAQVEAIGSFDLVLPNGLVICLDNCHYAPFITRGVVLVHRLVENGFVQCFTDFGISVSKNNVHYFNVVPGNGIYEIDMHDLVPNNNSIYNVSTKRAKHNLDSTYLWHCRLAHISKKRIEKLQQEGLLKSTNDESFDQCVSCLSGKMTRKSFPHHPERATNLLRIIHTDVCAPLRHVSRQGASYFITFTDDYSRYGYVYLLKHKHEVFETFKVFKNEVENQLGKTIKALRSDRGGEYISQEFKDYLKACGIVQQLTPPYTRSV